MKRIDRSNASKGHVNDVTGLEAIASKAFGVPLGQHINDVSCRGFGSVKRRLRSQIHSSYGSRVEPVAVDELHDSHGSHGGRVFVDVRYRAVFEAFLADHDLTHPPEGMVPEAARVLDKLLADSAELGRGHRVFKESVDKILSTSLEGSLDEVDRKLQNNTLDEQEKTELLLEKDRLRKERQDLGGQDWSRTVKKAFKDNHPGR